MKKESFADGLKTFFTRGSIVKKIRLNRRMKEIIIQMMQDSLENTAVDFGDSVEENQLYDKFMESMTWLKQEVNRTKIHRIKLTPKIGYIITMWIRDNRYHSLSNDPDYENAMQWIANKINSKYSMSELTEIKIIKK